MARWRVKKNEFGQVRRKLRRELYDGVTDVADEMANILRPILWVDTGVLKSTTEVRNKRYFHAEVGVGLNPARYGGNPRGFYAAYQEFGTRYQAARPIVGPTAQLFELRFAQRMASAVRQGCRV